MPDRKGSPLTVTLASAFLAAATALHPVAVRGQSADDPAKTVSDMLSDEIASRRSVFYTDGSQAKMSAYFDAAFASDYATVEGYSWPAIDGDLLSGAQDANSVSLGSVTTVAKDDTSATVDANVNVTPMDGAPYVQKTTFSMVLEGGAWKIDDMDLNVVAPDNSAQVPPTIRQTMRNAIAVGPNGY